MCVCVCVSVCLFVCVSVSVCSVAGVGSEPTTCKAVWCGKHGGQLYQGTSLYIECVLSIDLEISQARTLLEGRK